MNDELERIWKNITWQKLKYYRSSEGLIKTTKTSLSIAGLLVEIRNPEPPKYDAGVLSTRL
jgi:hypothetical protein